MIYLGMAAQKNTAKSQKKWFDKEDYFPKKEEKRSN
jgi:outer membrane lipoprotein-sorting protein